MRPGEDRPGTLVERVLSPIADVRQEDRNGHYAMAAARGRATMLGGVTARLLRNRVEKASVETATMYLNWIQQSLGMGR